MLTSLSLQPAGAYARGVVSPATQANSAAASGVRLDARLWQPFVVPSTSHNDAESTSSASYQNPGRAECARCNSRKLCMPALHEAKDLPSFRAVFGNSRRVRRGEAIYRAGDPFRNVYVARAGSSKTVAVSRDGREHITGFQIMGEFLGMEGISTGTHTVDAIALEDSTVCVIPFDALERLSETNREVRHHFQKIMSQEIVRESQVILLMGSMTAEERVASFLINLSKRYGDRGYSPEEFNLRMTRAEIGCYLGLKLETVSRMLSRLKEQGVIEVRGKQMRIVDAERLSCIQDCSVS
jgi:CRP/FNR family transcriptional regulator, anaerobic regulatory protein